MLLYPLWEFLDPEGVGYSCMFSYVNEGSLLRSEDDLSLFRAWITGFCCGCAKKALQRCGEPGEVADGGVVVVCE